MAQYTFTLYKIYSANCLLFVGGTKQPLQETLCGHFFKLPGYCPISIDCVTKIEFASFPTEADLSVYEVYERYKMKPALGRELLTGDMLTFELAEPKWEAYECPYIDVWREQIRNAGSGDEEKQRRRLQLENELQTQRMKVDGRTDLGAKEREALMSEWLKKYYEPARNGLL